MKGTRGTYFVVFVGLVVLLGASVLLDRMDLTRTGNHAAALTIAAAKAFLVVWFFMRARTSQRVTWFLFGAGFAWLVLLAGLVSLDVATRNLAVVHD
jgi:cytochrome c oxidase subunit IV